MAFSPEIANRFLVLSQKMGGKPLTHMQLQKLVYIAHGWSLALTGAPLTSDDPEAWDYGPVYRALYEALRKYRKSPVTRKIKRGDWELFPDDFDEEPEGDITRDQEAVIKKVYDTYGGFPAFRLSALTHQPNTPWDKIFNQEGLYNGSISSELIKEHFIDLATKQHTAA